MPGQKAGTEHWYRLHERADGLTHGCCRWDMVVDPSSIVRGCRTWCNMQCVELFMRTEVTIAPAHSYACHGRVNGILHTRSHGPSTVR